MNGTTWTKLTSGIAALALSIGVTATAAPAQASESEAYTANLNVTNAAVVADGVETAIIEVSGLSRSSDFSAVTGATFIVTHATVPAEALTVNSTELDNFGNYVLTVASTVAKPSSQYIIAANGVALDGVNLSFTAGPVDLSKTTISPVTGAVVVGTSRRFNVNPRDQYGNTSPTGVDTVTLEAGPSAIGTATLISAIEGAYEFGVSSSSMGSETFTVFVNGEATPATATVTYTAGAAEASQSTLTQVPDILTAATEPQIIGVVTLRDSFGNLVTNQASNITVSQPSDIVVTNNNDGTYTLTGVVTSAGDYTVAVSVRGQAMPAASFAVTAAAADATTSTLAPIAAVTVDSAPVQATVSVTDAFANPVTTGDEQVTVTLDGIDYIATDDDRDGIYTATVAIPNISGIYPVTATINGATGPSIDLQVAPGVASAANTTVSPTFTRDPGTGLYTGTVTLRDQYGNPVTMGGESVTVMYSGYAGDGEFPVAGAPHDVTDNGDGTYTITITPDAATIVGDTTLTVAVNGTPITGEQRALFVEYGPVDLAPGSGTSFPTRSWATAGGTDTPLWVVLHDIHGNRMTALPQASTGGMWQPTIDLYATLDMGSEPTVYPLQLSGNIYLPVTAPVAATTVGDYSVSFTLDGVEVASGTVTVNPASPHISTTTMTSPVSNPDGSLTATITMRDEFGNITPNSFAINGVVVPVTVAAGSARTALVDNGDGTLTVTIYPQTTTGSPFTGEDTITVLIANDPITQGATTVTLTAGAVAPGNTTVTSPTATVCSDEMTNSGWGGCATVAAGGNVTYSISVRDTYGNPIVTGTESVAVTLEAIVYGHVSEAAVTHTATDVDRDGTYVVTFTAPVVAQDRSILFEVDGVTISYHLLSVTAGEADPSASAVTVPTSMAGSTDTVVSVDVKDTYGNPVTNGAEQVTVTLDGFDYAATDDDRDGTYTATITAPTTAGDYLTVVSINGSVIPAGSLTVIAGAASAAASTITSPAQVTAGSTDFVFTVSIPDMYGNPITSGTEQVTVTLDGIDYTATDDDRDGTYAATITAPTTAGVYLVAVAVNDDISLSVASLTVDASNPNAASTTITSPVVAGDGTVTATVTLVDQFGNAVSGATELITITTSLGTATVTDNGDGTYLVTVTAPATGATGDISVSVNGESAGTSSTVTVPDSTQTAPSEPVTPTPTTPVTPTPPGGGGGGGGGGGAPAPTTPTAPTGLSAVVSGTTVTMTWKDSNAAGATFRVEGSKDGGATWETITTATSTTATVQIASNGTWTFRVISIVGTTASTPSTPSNAVTVTGIEYKDAITAPEVRVTGTTITLDWGALQSGIDQYRISSILMQGGVPVDGSAMEHGVVDNTTFAVKGLRPGTYLITVAPLVNGQVREDYPAATVTVTIPTIVGDLTGKRAAVNRVQVVGNALDLAGETLSVFVKLQGQKSYVRGTATPTVNADGTFTWSRKTGKKIYVFFVADNGQRTERVVLPRIAKNTRVNEAS